MKLLQSAEYEKDFDDGLSDVWCFGRLIGIIVFLETSDLYWPYYDIVSRIEHHDTEIETDINRMLDEDEKIDYQLEISLQDLKATIGNDIFSHRDNSKKRRALRGKVIRELATHGIYV